MSNTAWLARVGMSDLRWGFGLAYHSFWTGRFVMVIATNTGLSSSPEDALVGTVL